MGSMPQTSDQQTALNIHQLLCKRAVCHSLGKCTSPPPNVEYLVSREHAFGLRPRLENARLTRARLGVRLVAFGIVKHIQQKTATTTTTSWVWPIN